MNNNNLKEIDILGPGINLSHLRGKAVEWIGLFATEDTALVMPPPTLQSRMFSFIEPFSPWVNHVLLLGQIGQESLSYK